MLMLSGFNMGEINNQSVRCLYRFLSTIVQSLDIVFRQENKDRCKRDARATRRFFKGSTEKHYRLTLLLPGNRVILWISG